MNDYRKVRLDLSPCTEDATDIMAALLADIGFESFVPDDCGLDAYIQEPLFDAQALNSAIAEFPFAMSIDVATEKVEGRDWNAEWEQNYFQPIVVGDRCVIHSSFHTDIPACEFDITIDPKMAFGTGHHATTSLIIEQLLTLPLQGKAVIDMGTGTGILAILAAMRGASPVIGIEIDEFAYTNAIDNVALNGHAEIALVNSDASALAGKEADVFIANINRNVITADLPAYAATLRPGAVMILSGFYTADIPVVLAAATPLGLHEISHSEKGDSWACLVLTNA